MQFGLDVLTVEALSSAEEIQVCGSLRKLNFSQCGWCCSHRKLRENKKIIEKIGKDSYRIKRDSNLREMISSCFLSGCSKPCHSVVFDCEMSLSYFFLTPDTADIPSTSPGNQASWTLSRLCEPCPLQFARRRQMNSTTRCHSKLHGWVMMGYAWMGIPNSEQQGKFQFLLALLFKMLMETGFATVKISESESGDMHSILLKIYSLWPMWPDILRWDLAIDPKMGPCGMEQKVPKTARLARGNKIVPWLASDSGWWLWTETEIWKHLWATGIIVDLRAHASCGLGTFLTIGSSD